MSNSPGRETHEEMVCCNPASQHIARISNTNRALTAHNSPRLPASSLRDSLLGVLHKVGHGGQSRAVVSRAVLSMTQPSACSFRNPISGRTAAWPSTSLIRCTKVIGLGTLTAIGL